MLATEAQLKTFMSLFTKGSKLTYKKGEYIIRPGEAPSHVFYIQDGMVKAFNISKYGEENLLIIRKKHEIFPLIWAITGQGRSIIYQAMCDTVVRRIDRDTFTNFLLEQPDAMYPFLDLVIAQYKNHSERILNLEYRTVRERLVSFLLTMMNRHGKQIDRGTLIDIPLKQQDIASSINASRETTSREISALENKQLISHEAQQRILILDKTGLHNFL